jgi:hypothetical protein
MKHFIHKVQDLGKKAAELRQVVQSAPAKAAELREALVMTAGELQQIRTDVQSNLAGLRVNSEDRIIQAMREVTEAAPTFEEAGYLLAAMDLDFSLAQRLAVRLEKVRDVPHGNLRSLAAREVRQTVKPILAGLIKAEETAANIELSGLTYCELIVHVGAAPAIRMCWRSDVAAEEVSGDAVPAAVPSSVPPPPLPASTSLPVSPAFGSFFEQRTVPRVAPVEPAPVPEAPAASVPATAPEPPPATSSDMPWSKSSLDRFKKMPGASKYSRY